MRSKDLLLLAAVGFGLYYLSTKLTPAAPAAALPAPSGGNVILPTGASVPFASLAPAFDATLQAISFTQYGTTYVLQTDNTGAPYVDSNGNYHAITAAQYQTQQAPASS